MRSEHQRLMHEHTTMTDKIKDNTDKIGLSRKMLETSCLQLRLIEQNRQLPYLVSNVIEILDMDPSMDGGDNEELEGANVDLDSVRRGKSAVIKTSTRQTVFLPLIGLVDAETLKPSDLIGVNKDSYLVLDTLPAEYDSRVKAMEVDEKPLESYTDIGGLDKQIEELVEAVVLPMQHAERFQTLGIKPPKGALMYGPPGTGKTLLARACAAQTNATFLKLAGPQLVQVCEKSYEHESSLGRCSLAMVQNWYEMRSHLPRKKHQQSYSLTNLTRSVLNGSTARSRETERCSAQCWNCSINSTASAQMIRSK